MQLIELLRRQLNHRSVATNKASDLIEFCAEFQHVEGDSAQCVVQQLVFVCLDVLLLGGIQLFPVSRPQDAKVEVVLSSHFKVQCQW